MNFADLVVQQKLEFLLITVLLSLFAGLSYGAAPADITELASQTPANSISSVATGMSDGSLDKSQPIDCARCHKDVMASSEAHPDTSCQDCHTNVTSADHQAKTLSKLTGNAICSQCHEESATDIEHSAHHQRRAGCLDCHGPAHTVHNAIVIEPGDEASKIGDAICVDCHRKNVRDLSKSIHSEHAGCQNCHGSAHRIHNVTDLESEVSPAGQIKTCGVCHDSPPEIIDNFVNSVHGIGLLKSGLVVAPSCNDCHTAHSILAVEDTRSATTNENSPQMCGQCHSLILKRWSDSKHGQAWKKGEKGPVCTSCHSTHSIVDPETANNRLNVAENCKECHKPYYDTYRDSFHGKAGDLGLAVVANCSDCHSPHSNYPADNGLSSVHKDNLQQTCSKCHQNVSASFLSFDPHSDPSNPDDNYQVYLVWLFMTILLLGTFGFFAIHDLLWLQRSLVGVMRGEYRFTVEEGAPWIRRFRTVNVKTHIVIIITFLALALTGLPQKFHYAPWAQVLVDSLGGMEVVRFIHRIAAVGTFGYFCFHVAEIFYRALVKKERGMFWGTTSMMPQPRDVSDLFGNLRYFLYLGERPPGDRWIYFEKFDYLAVFWGVAIIGTSGLLLWFPEFSTHFLPGWVLNAAYVVHSDEALLATGFIFIFHFFHSNLRPEVFPMDIVVFTGKMPLARLKHERPLEYQRLADAGILEKLLVEAPTQKQRLKAYIFGTCAMSTGIVLAAGILVALFFG